MLPNMANVLRGWRKDVTIKTVTRTTTNFVETDTVVTRSQLCVIQVFKSENLNSTTLDWAQEYIEVHSVENISLGEFIEFNGKDFKVISKSPYAEYGFTLVIAESTNKPLIH